MTFPLWNIRGMESAQRAVLHLVDRGGRNVRDDFTLRPGGSLDLCFSQLRRGLGTTMEFVPVGRSRSPFSAFCIRGDPRCGQPSLNEMEPGHGSELHGNGKGCQSH